MIYRHTNYQSYLRAELVQRIQRNSKYSLRAFSKQIGVSPAMLSEVLNGLKDLSVQKALDLSSKLFLNPQEAEYWLLLVRLANAQNVELKSEILNKIKTINPHHEGRDLSIDHFESVANWICVAGLTLLDKQERSASHLAGRLGVTTAEIVEAMDRWVALDLVECLPKQIYKRIDSSHVRLHAQTPQKALQQFHQAMLEKAKEAMLTQSNEQKFVGSETLMFDSAQLKQANQIFEEAFQKIIQLAEQKSKTDQKEVYHMGIQFFRLSKTNSRPKGE